MTNHIAANLLAPSIFEKMQAALATPARKTTAGANAAATITATDTTTGTGIDSTFLNLLIKELQNQDPSAPMDSTAMVGQMISLNQLDQLISIDQKFPSTTTPAAGAGAVPGTLANNSLTAPAASTATATAARLTKPQASPASLADLFPFGQGGLAAPVEPIFGGVNGQLPLSLDDPSFGLSTPNSISGGK
jgi:flagellar basal-body rod modification protein FlgD